MKNVDNSNLDNNVVFNEPQIKLGSSKQNIFKKIFNSLCVFAAAKTKVVLKYDRNCGLVIFSK